MSKEDTVNSEQLLMSVPRAAKALDLSIRSVRRHFELVHIGRTARVRVADIQKMIDRKGVGHHV